jgi:uncharacterized protein (DUF2236 family)
VELPRPVRVGVDRIGTTAGRLLFGDGTGAPDDRGDLGRFTPDSVVWRLHADASMLVAGLRTVVVQTLHPLVMAGVADHSDYRHDPWGRLQRTIDFIDAVTYGSVAEADAAFARVRAIHRSIRGVAPDGRVYDASDPELVAWVHGVLVDSALRAYERFGPARLEPADADRYVAEMAVVAERLESSFVPRDVAGLRRWLDGVEGLAVGPDTRAAAFYLLARAPVPLYARGAYITLSAAALSLMPGWARWRLALPGVPLAEPLLVWPATRLTLAVGNRVLPPSPCRAAAEAKIAREGTRTLN